MSAVALRQGVTVKPQRARPVRLQPLRHWLAGALQLLAAEATVVRVVLAAVRGSAPREPGACMLVGFNQVLGTIGGGALEWEAVRAARSLLSATTAPVLTQKIVLGTDRAQCCGGVVHLWLERYTRADRPWLEAAQCRAQAAGAVLVSVQRRGRVRHRVVMSAAASSHPLPRLAPRAGAAALAEALDEPLPLLWLYGAGHVGQALARLLADLPLQVTWIDSRPELLSDIEHVQRWCAAAPIETVSAARPGTRFVVLTHSHALDYGLCRAILARDDFSWLGLIGSDSKAARFRSRLARDGISPLQIARLVCPIGIEGIKSKWPPAIAVSVAAQLLRELTPPAAPTVAAAPHNASCSGCRSCTDRVS